jgi:hypothetical protein
VAPTVASRPPRLARRPLPRSGRDRNAARTLELAHLADPAIGNLLTERGYRLVSFENVLGRTLHGEFGRVTPPGVEVRPSGDDEFGAWLDVVVDGAVHPDAQGVPTHEEFPREVVEKAERDLGAAGVERYIALRDGVFAGGGSLRLSDGIAQLTGAATAPAHRWRDVQTALLAARFGEAKAAGCDIAVVTTSRDRNPSGTCSGAASTCSSPRAVLVKQG